MKRVMMIRAAALLVFLVLILTGRPVLWLLGFVLSLLVATRYGRFYCGYLCPINTVMTPLDKALKQQKRSRQAAPQWLVSGWLPWLTLILSAALALLTARAKGRPFPVLLLWLGAGALMTLRYKPEVFHNKVCPYGALQKVAGSFSKNGHQVAPSLCQGHRACEKACLAQAVVYDTGRGHASVDVALCHQCGRCAQACPSKAISYQKDKAA